MLEEIYLYISSIMNMDGNGSSKAKPYAWPYILDTWHKLFFNLGLAILKGYCSLKSNFKDHITVKAQSTIFSCRFNWMYFQILDNFRILLLLLEIQQLRDNTKNALSSQCSKITIMKFKLTQLNGKYSQWLTRWMASFSSGVIVTVPEIMESNWLCKFLVTQLQHNSLSIQISKKPNTYPPPSPPFPTMSLDIIIFKKTLSVSNLQYFQTTSP